MKIATVNINDKEAMRNRDLTTAAIWCKSIIYACRAIFVT